MTWVTSILVSILIAVLIRFFIKFLKYWKYFNSMPGETNFSFLYGNMHKYPGPNEDGIVYDMDLAQRCRTFHRCWAGPVTPVLICYHPETVRVVLKSSAPKPRNKIVASPYDMGVKWLGEGLLIANGHKWSRNRRLLTPSFHFDILKSYMCIFNTCSKSLLNNLKSLSEKKEGFDIFKPISMNSLDAILQCVFSYQSDCQTKSLNEYEEALTELIQLWTDRTFIPPLYLNFIYNLTSAGKRFAHLCNVVHDIAESLIKRRKEALGKDENFNKDRKIKDFLDTLLTARDEDGNGLSMLDIRNEVDTFLFEGHDTTTSGMSWTLYCLAQHPEYQEKVFQEVGDVMKDKDELEWNDLGKLEFTTMCMKEALRLHTAVPFIERKLNEPLVLDGFTIPEGTLVAIQIWILHHNPHLWDQPHTFDPYRFTPDNQVKMDPFQYLPFSAGSRNCIGQNFALNEMKVTVAQVIKNFQLSIDEDSPQLRRFVSITLKPEKGAMLQAVPRKTSRYC